MSTEIDILQLAPLGDRVLIRPDGAIQTVTESGVALVEDDPDETTGTVVAVGRPRHPRKDEAFALAEHVDSLSLISVDSAAFQADKQALARAATLLRELTGREPVVQVGDRVGFARYGGQELRLNNERYLLLREADLLVVLENEESLT
jgi:co-chaperonin GroES (HSP10)